MSKLLAMMIMSAAIVLFIQEVHAQNNMPLIAEFQGEHYLSGFGGSMATLDFNHDGYDDLIIVSNYYGYHYPGTTDPSRGKVYIYYGGPGFNSSTPASITLEGDNTTVAGKVITAVYNIGDVNGDGFDDLCLYDLSSMGNEEDRLRFYFGNASDLENPDYVIMIPISSHFHRVSKLGDFNGDGFDDVGIDIRYSAINIFSILWGGSFIEQIVSSGEGSPSYATSIIGIGDINNDGYDDFSLGFTNPDPNTGFHLVRIYYGNPAGDVSNPVVLIQTQDPITKVSKPLGDLNGDGYDDFMGYVSNNGMHAWLGGQNINYTIPDFNFVPEYYGGEYTLSVEYGDFNNDGFDDVVGASFYQRKFSVWLGKQNVNGTSDYIVSRLAYDNFGLGLTTGDFNADGFCDIAISAPFEDSPMPSGTFTGYVWIHGGNAQLTDTTVSNDDPELPGIDEQMSIRISPNPVFNADIQIVVEVSDPQRLKEQGSIEIFNIKGQKVFAADFQPGAPLTRITVPASSMANGIYICRARLGNITIREKFTLIK